MSHDSPEFLSALDDPGVGPVDWTSLDPERAEAEWYDLDQWVRFLKTTYGLPPSVLPPFWHRHPELVWELSALHTSWRDAYHHHAPGFAPCGWHHEFAEARHRLREWVSNCGTRLDHDRPTRQTVWPGEQPPPAAIDTAITDRDEDFREFVAADVEQRRKRSRPA